MTIYLVRFTTKAEVELAVEAEDEDAAAEVGWDRAQEYVATLSVPDSHGVSVHLDLDGTGADDVTPAAAQRAASPVGREAQEGERS